MFEKDKIVIIGNSHGWSGKYIRDAGYRFVDAYKNYGVIFRIVREIAFRLKLPGISFFYNKDIPKYKDKVFVVGDSLITYEYVKWLHEKCPTCKIILKYDNPANPRYSPDGFSNEWCTKWTSDKDDAIKYNMHLIRGGGYLPQWKVKKQKPEYDVFYIGKDKNRLGQLQKIEKQLQDHGAVTLFYITWARGWQRRNDGIHKPFLPYEDVLKYLGKTKAILHLKDGAQNGVTLRIQESLIHRIKLITDDKNITKYDFYHPDNIFILGVDDLGNLRNFLASPYKEVESDFYKHAYFDDMISNILSSIN